MNINFFSLVYNQVVTFWEGEIVDIKNYTFFTNKWEATYDSFHLLTAEALEIL